MPVKFYTMLFESIFVWINLRRMNDLKHVDMREIERIITIRINNLVIMVKTFTPNCMKKFPLDAPKSNSVKYSNSPYIFCITKLTMNTNIDTFCKMFK